MRKLLMLGFMAAASPVSVAFGEVPGNLVKVGVLSDFSGPFADQAGNGSLVAAQMAAEDFAAESKGLKVEIVSADHQNKPDVGASIARRWIDQDGVTAIVDLPNSGIAPAVNTTLKEKNRTMLASGSATSGKLKVCRDGRAIHTMFVFEVKTPEESRGRYDSYKLVRAIAPEEALRPLDQGGCPLVH